MIDLRSEKELTVCVWANAHPLLRPYHDDEWGRPERDSRTLWEKLVLDGFQAGLSWLTILKKRDAFREAFEGFAPEVVAGFGTAEVNRLLGNDGIIRSRAKIEAAVGNARAYLAMREAGEDFSTFLWAFVGGGPVVNTWTAADQVPAKTPLSEQVSKALKARGFKFVGPVIVYA
ncbi:MAG TPA: DNA-3-methyladenine glycosylase I [Urbifossiella sp.]|jgi:DNA-3-methyladenine glycosylase I|nr:DNA-3-methyladenine glycosylase I [Urbifossiella sp.]